MLAHEGELCAKQAEQAIKSQGEPKAMIRVSAQHGDNLQFEQRQATSYLSPSMNRSCARVGQLFQMLMDDCSRVPDEDRLASNVSMKGSSGFYS